MTVFVFSACGIQLGGHDIEVESKCEGTHCDSY